MAGLLGGTGIQRFVLNRATVSAMLKGNGFATASVLTGPAARIAAAAGEGFEASAPFVGKNRIRVTVSATTYKARQREARHHVLANAIGAAR